MPNGLPISISGTAPSYGPNLAIMAATERQAMKHGAALCLTSKEGADSTVCAAKKEGCIHPERDILSNRLNAGILQKHRAFQESPYRTISSLYVTTRSSCFPTSKAHWQVEAHCTQFKLQLLLWEQSHDLLVFAIVLRKLWYIFVAFHISCRRLQSLIRMDPSDHRNRRLCDTDLRPRQTVSNWHDTRLQM